MPGKRLYFIAILPPVEVREQITAFKLDFADRFNTSRALRVMPHITLQSPFKRSEDIESPLVSFLEDFFRKYKPFNIRLKGFSFFDSKPGKVVFVDVEKNPTLEKLHEDLAFSLRSEMNFPERETTLRFHPHITVAYRDLEQDQFDRAWKEYQVKEYKASWKVDRVALLKQEQNRWEALAELLLS